LPDCKGGEMNAEQILYTLIGVFSTGVVGIICKIVFDWLKNGRKNGKNGNGKVALVEIFNILEWLKEMVEKNERAIAELTQKIADSNIELQKEITTTNNLLERIVAAIGEEKQLLQDVIRMNIRN